MATPAMQLQGTPMLVNGAAPGSLRILTKNPDGTTLDVHSGYSVGKFQGFPNGASAVWSSPIDLSSFITAAFDATGVTISWTKAQAASIMQAVLGLPSQYGLSLSNDSGTTATECAQGTMSNVNPQGFTF